MAKNILITGSPSCGKTTLIEKVAYAIHVPLAGFLTREIRERGNRVGFSIETFAGEKGVLAHVGIQSPHRIGKYAVNIAILEAIAIPSLSARSPSTLIVIDEIGKMECLSPSFRRAVLDVLDSANPVLASIALRGDAFMEAIKSREDVLLHEVKRENRDVLAASIGDELRTILKAFS